MNWLESILSFITGVGLRLLIPVALTAAVIYFLRRLDIRWQGEVSNLLPASQKPECWKVNGCPEEKRKNCKGAQSPEPCWQAFRQPNGYLKEECLGCQVFRSAPAPIKV